MAHSNLYRENSPKSALLHKVYGERMIPRERSGFNEYLQTVKALL